MQRTTEEKIRKEIEELESLIEFHKEKFLSSWTLKAMRNYSLTIAHLDADVRMLKNELIQLKPETIISP